jgi:hypothetical protein
MIRFTVRHRCRGMGVSGKVMHFGELIVWTLWHGVLLR